MAIGLMQLVMQRELSVIVSHLALFYPITDIATSTSTSPSTSTSAYKCGTSKSKKEPNPNPLMTARTLDWMVSAFLSPPSEGHNNALISPLGSAPDTVLAKFPPTTVFVAGEDPLADEGEAFGRRLESVGVDAAVLKAEGQVHDFAMLEAVRRSATAQAVVELAALKLRRAIRRE